MYSYFPTTTPWTAAHQTFLSFTISWSLIKLMSIESVMPSNYLILCHPLLPLLSIFPSIRIFSNESVIHTKWPKYCSFRFSISPSNVYSGLFSFRIDCFDPLAVQKTLKRFLQHHNSKASILQHSLLCSSPPESIHDYWKTPDSDYTDLCQKSDISTFLIPCLGLSFLSFQEASVF